MLTQNFSKKCAPSHSKFFKFQIKKAKSPLDNEERNSAQRQILSLKRIKSAGKYKNINEQNTSNCISKLNENIQAKITDDMESRSSKNIFQKIRDRQQQKVGLKLNLVKQSQMQKQMCLQFSQKIKCKNGIRSSVQKKQFNSIKSTEFKQSSTSKILNKKQQKQKTSSLIQFKTENNQINKNCYAKSYLREENHKYQDQYQLFAKVNIKNSNQNLKITPYFCTINSHNQTADSANASSSIEKINQLQKQLIRKNQLLKILERKCAQNNLDGLKALQRSKSITQKRNSIDRNTTHNVNEITLKEYEQKNNELKNRIYYLQKRCQAMIKSNNTMKDQLQMKQKVVRNSEQNMLKVYHQNFRYLNQLQNNKKKICELEVQQNELLKKSLDLQVSLQIIKQQNQLKITQKVEKYVQITNNLQIEKVLQYNFKFENKEIDIQSLKYSQNTEQKENFLDISRQIIKEVQKIQSKSKYLPKKQLDSLSFQNICILQTNDELPKVDLFEKFYFQIGDLFSITFQNDVYEYHNQILDQIQQFKSTISQLVKSIKILTLKVQQSQQKQKHYQDQIRILRCKIQKMIQQIDKNQYFLNTYQNLIQQLNNSTLKKQCQKKNQRYQKLFQQQSK